MGKAFRYCIVCKRNKENSISHNEKSPQLLFSFPTNLDQRKAWLNILQLHENDIKTRSKVCELHFSSNQFASTQLKKDAIPTSKLCETSVNREPKQTLVNSNTANKLKYILPKSSSRAALPMGPFQPQSSNIQVPNLSSIKNVVDYVPAPVANTSIHENVNHTQLLTPKPISHLKCKRRLRSLEIKIDELKRENATKIDIAKIFASKPEFLKFIEIQVERYNTKSCYTNFEKILALPLHYTCGTAGYRSLIGIGFKLPSESSLRSWLSVIPFRTGINLTIMECLEKLLKSTPAMGNDCTLIWDEMSLKEWVEFNKQEDKFEGIVDLDKAGRSLDSANEVLVFMVQGIKTHYRFPISFYFSRNSTESTTLHTLVTENISSLFMIGYNVRMCVCDMSFTNQGLYRKLGVTQSQPFTYLMNRKVYFIHDSPHLIKLVRNNLLKHQFEVKKNVGKHSIIEKIRWSHIVGFYNRDRRMLSRMAPKLSNAHMFLKDFSKMRVKLASQVLSHSVYAGMMAMAELKILKNMKPTALFVKQLDEIFDFLNMSKFDDDKYNRCAKHFFSRIHQIDDYVVYLKSISIPSYSKAEPEFLKGLILTLTGIKMVSLDLQQEGFNVIYTRRLQQDVLENFFASIRMKSGSCHNPTVRQFRQNFRTLFFSQVMINKQNGNTENLSSAFFRRLRMAERVISIPKRCRKQKTSKGAASKIMDNTDSNAILFYSLETNRKQKYGEIQEENVACYIGGACVHSILKSSNCDSCRELITSSNSGSTKNTLISYKKFGETSSLFYLSKSAELFFCLINKLFLKYVTTTLSSTGENVVCSIYEKYFLEPQVNLWLKSAKCISLGHRESILKYFIRVKLYRLIKDKNEVVKKTKSWDQSRRELRNQ